LTDYSEYLEKYHEKILSIVAERPRITIGDLIKCVHKEMKGSRKSKSEIRDAILFLAGLKKLYIEMVTPKRLEVTRR